MALYLPARSVLRVAGDDAGAFLDALVTNDVSAADGARSVYAALLSPQGKLISDMVAHRADDGALLLDVPRGRASDVLGRLTMYRLRRKIALTEVSGTHAVVIMTHDQTGHTTDPRRPDGALGARFVSASPPPHTDPLEDYERLRITAGVPDPVVDAGPEEVFALEGLLEELHGVDFQKGCFIGQENVSRMKRRATTRKKFCRIAFEGPAPPYGAPVMAGDAASTTRGAAQPGSIQPGPIQLGPIELGEVRTGVDGCAIALLRLDRAREAIDAGASLTAGDVPVRLDPPAWLLMPAR